MATTSSNSDQDSRHRATAVKHAVMLEEKKKLKSRILDLILEGYELPSQNTSSPSEASSVDIQLFKTCLSLFQPSDFDALVGERNIDGRCGYALCAKPNKKLAPGGDKVWNGKAGREFRLVDRADLEKWCSAECGQRAAFVQSQLSTEPAWLRDSQNQNIQLLDEMSKTDDLVGALQELAISGVADDELNAKLRTLSIERGEVKSAKGVPISIEEKHSNLAPAEPSLSQDDDSIEGHKPRQVRFANTRDKGEARA